MRCFTLHEKPAKRNSCASWKIKIKYLFFSPNFHSLSVSFSTWPVDVKLIGAIVSLFLSSSTSPLRVPLSFSCFPARTCNDHENLCFDMKGNFFTITYACVPLLHYHFLVSFLSLSIPSQKRHTDIEAKTQKERKNKTGTVMNYDRLNR